MSTPFARAKAMFAAITAAMALSGSAKESRLGSIGEYRSRGKGRGTPSRRYGNKPGKYTPHQSHRERKRRRARMGL